MIDRVDLYHWNLTSCAYCQIKFSSESIFEYGFTLSTLEADDVISVSFTKCKFYSTEHIYIVGTIQGYLSGFYIMQILPEIAEFDQLIAHYADRIGNDPLDCRSNSYQ